MTDRATLEALLARVLEGTGPDRELDAEIDLYLLDAGLRKQRFSIPFDAPRYTASLDAALTLVPEGWIWVIGSYGNARVYQEQTAGKSFIGENASPARALCEAALQARMEALGE